MMKTSYFWGPCIYLNRGHTLYKYLIYTIFNYLKLLFRLIVRNIPLQENDIKNQEQRNEFLKPILYDDITEITPNQESDEDDSILDTN